MGDVPVVVPEPERDRDMPVRAREFPIDRTYGTYSVKSLKGKKSH